MVRKNKNPLPPKSICRQESVDSLQSIKNQSLNINQIKYGSVTSLASFNQNISDQDENRIIREILNHALDFNNKYKVEDLNLLDVLNSYDELIKNYNLNKEQSNKIYRKLLQLQRENSEKQNIDQNKENTNSKYSTLNQDLQFDFLGSFGNTNAANKHRSQSQVKDSYISNDQLQSKLGQVEPPSVMNSQFQSLAQSKNPQILFQSKGATENFQTKSIEGFPISGLINNHQFSLFDSKLYGNHQSSVNSAFSTLNINALGSQQNTNRDQPQIQKGISTTIKLPKLSFNDLIQAQNYESFKKINEQSSQLIKDDSTETLSQLNISKTNQCILTKSYENRYDPYQNEEEELKSQEMSVFRSNKKFHDQNNFVNESSMLKYSNKQSFTYLQDCQNTQMTNTDEMVVTSKFPKLKLITESELQSLDNQIFNLEASLYNNNNINNNIQDKENQQILSNRADRKSQVRSQSREKTIKSVQDQKIISSKSSKRENVIDSEIQLALAFKTRKLLLKAWKSWLIVKVHKYHKQHLQRLAKTYFTKKISSKYYQHWKLFIKLILPQERLHKKANQFYTTRIKAKVLHLLKIRAMQNKTKQVRLLSIERNINQIKLKNAFSKFKQSISTSILRRTQKYTGIQMYYQKLKIQALKALIIISNVKKRQRHIKMRTKVFYEQSLAKKALFLLQQNAFVKIQAKRKIINARDYFNNHHNFIIVNKAYQILRQFAIHNRKNKLAIQQNSYWIQYRCFKNLKLNTYLKRGVKNQRQFVQRYHNHSLLLKSLKSLIMYSNEQKDRHFLVVNYMRRTKVRKLFRAIYRNKCNNYIYQAAYHRIFINCAKTMLEQSFAKVMNSVWQEFPNQKQTINKITQKQNLLLNYIGLSKNKRYRNFYYQANENYRKAQLQSIFKALKEQTFIKRSFRQRIQYQFLSQVFTQFKKYTRRMSLINSIIQSKNKKRDIILTIKVFKAFKKQSKLNAKMNKQYYKVLLMRKKRIISKHFQVWMNKYNQFQKITYNEEIANKIYRHRNLSKFLAIWLKQLHQELKINHLDQLSKNFQNTIVKRRFLRQWYQQYQRVSYLQDQEYQINNHQTNLLLYKSYQKLKQYTIDKQRKRMKIQAADQEYKYWLGRQAMTNLYLGIQNQRSQNKLYEFLDQERLVKQIKKVFQSLKLFKEFIQQRQINDEILTRNIKTIQKQIIFKKWFGKLNRNLSCNILSKTINKIELRMGVQRIQHIIAFQDSIIEVMNQKREAYLILQHYNAIKKNKNINNYHIYLVDYLKSRNIHTNMKNSFKKWQSTFKQRRRQYVTYAFTVIQLKNKFLERILCDWKQYVGYKNLKKDGNKQYIRNLKFKVFKFLKMKSMKSQNNMNNYDYIKQKLMQKRKIQNFKIWREEFLTIKWLQARYLQHQNNKKKQIFQALVQHKELQQNKKQYLEDKEAKLNLQYMKIYLNKLRLIVFKRVQLKNKLHKGKQFNQQYMFRKAFQSWVNFYNQDKQLIRNQVKIKRKHQQQIKQTFMKIWLKKSEKSLKKLRALKNIIKLRNKHMISKRFDTWIQQTNFLITLCDRVELLQNQRKLQQQYLAVNQLKDFSNKRLLFKQRNQDICEYYKKKLLIRGSVALVKYLEHRRQQNINKDLSFLQYAKWVKKNNFNLFRFITIQQHLLHQAQGMFKNSQKLIYVPQVLNKLSQNKISRQNYNTKLYYSTAYRTNHSLRKVFSNLQQNMQKQKVIKELINQAYNHYKINLAQNTLRKFLDYKNQRQLIKQKRNIMFQVIQTMDEDSQRKAVLKIFKLNMIMEKEEKNNNHNYLKHLKKKRVFQSMKLHSNVKTSTKNVYQITYKRNMKNQKLKYYNIWKNQFINYLKIHSYNQKKNMQVKHKIMQILIQKQKENKKIYLMLVSKNYQLKSIVLSNLNQYSKKQKLENFKKMQAKLQYNRHLAFSIFKAFNKVKQYEFNVIIGQQNHKVILKKNALISLLQHFQIKKYLIEQKMLKGQKLIKTVYDSWKQALFNRLMFKQKLITLLEIFEIIDKQQSFRQWKRGAFFMKTCELIYTHRYQEEEQQTIQSCFKEWRRYQLHQQNKVQQFHALRENHFYHQKKKAMKEWLNHNKVRCNIFIKKMDKIVRPRYCDTIEDLFRYAFKDQELECRVERFERKIQNQTRQRFFYEWLIRLQQKEQYDILQQKQDTRLMKKTLKAFDMYRLQKIQDKYQMLKIIQFYSQRRPELLLCYSKTFLCLNNQYASTISSIEDGQKRARICSTALAKYIFEKWKNVKDVIQVDNDMKRQADELYVYNFARRYISEWRNTVQVRCHKRSLKLSCQEFNYVNLMKKGLQGFKLNIQKNAYNYHLQQCQHEVLKIKSESLFQKYFTLWRNKFEMKYRIQNAQQEIIVKYNLNLVHKCLTALKNYSYKRQSKHNKYGNAFQQLQNIKNFTQLKKITQSQRNIKKQKNEIKEAAFNHYNAKIITKYFILFKTTIMEQKLKNKHSKLFSIFVAWKFYVKENKLVQKYLSECNYQSIQNQSKVKQSKGNASKQHKRAISSQKENLESFNDSGLEMKQYRMEKQQHQFLSNNSKYPNQDFNSITSNNLNHHSDNVLAEKQSSFFNQLSLGTSNKTRQNPLNQQNSKLFTPTLGSNNVNLQQQFESQGISNNNNNSNGMVAGGTQGIFGSSFFKNNFGSLISDGSDGRSKNLNKSRGNSKEVTQQLKIFNQRFYNQ